jgi:hypothetical protein
MHESFAAGPPSDSCRRARGVKRLLAAWLLLAVCAAASVPAWAGKVQETGPPYPMKTHDCTRCNVQAVFAEKIRGMGASIEFVELKNGVGVLYSVEDPHDVPRVQRAAEWARNELQSIADEPDHYQLCSYCKATMAVFSKVNREVVRTTQGALFLMRSEDPEAVRALRGLMTKAQKREATAPAPSR